jgi:hypothetical protein
MTVDELRSELVDLPGDMEVVTVGRSGEDAGTFYEVKGCEAATLHLHSNKRLYDFQGHTSARVKVLVLE